MARWSRMVRKIAVVFLIPVLLLGTGVFRIALRYGTTVEALAAANQITDPTHITVGQVLTIPGGADSVQPQPQTQTQTQAQNQAQTQPPAQAPAAKAAPVYYTVQDGDTL